MQVRLCISVSKPPSLTPPSLTLSTRESTRYLPTLVFISPSLHFFLYRTPAVQTCCTPVCMHAYKHLHHEIGADTGPCAPKAAMVCKSAKSCLAATCVHLVLVGRNGHKSGWPGVGKELRAQCSQECSIRQSTSQQLYANHLPSCRARHSPPHDEPAP